jgi:hypothetical protein
MAAKKCKCGRKLILEMDKVRGRCFECVELIFLKPLKGQHGYQNQMQEM